MLDTSKVPNMNRKLHTKRNASLVYAAQHKVRPMAPKTAEELDLSVRQNPDFRRIARDCADNVYFIKKNGIHCRSLLLAQLS